MKALRLSCLALGALAFLARSGFGLDAAGLHEKGRRQIEEAVQWAKDLESKRHADFDRAEAVLWQAQVAQMEARKEEDFAALSVANEAEKKALTDVARAKALWDLAEESVRLAEAVAKDWNYSETFLFSPVNVKGSVEIKTKNSVRPFNGVYTFHRGDTITTGPNSSLSIRSPQGHIIVIPENSTFTIDSEPGWIEGVIFRLIKGRIHINRPNQPPNAILGSNDEPLYRTARAVAAVRGTEFEMAVDTENNNHFIPIAGIVELSAVPGTPEQITAWALDAAQTAYQAPSGMALARVSAVSGEASITASDETSRPAGVGDPVAAGQQVKTGAGGFVLLDLVDGQRAVLAPGSRLSAGAHSKSGAAYYALKTGRARFWGTGEAVGTRILTPNSVAEPRATQYEIGLGEGGVADFSISGGTLTITAVKSRLDLSKIDQWWEQ